MKTILVKFNGKGPSYAFKTKDTTIKYGDILRSSSYTDPMFVIGICDKEYKYVNTDTGELTDEINSTKCERIKILVLNSDEDIVYASKIDNTKAIITQCLKYLN